MKRLLALCIVLLSLTPIFAKKYKIESKGEVFKQDIDGNIVPLEKEDTITEEDVIILKNKATVILYIDGEKIIIKNKENFTVKELLEN